VGENIDDVEFVSWFSDVMRCNNGDSGLFDRCSFGRSYRFCKRGEESQAEPADSHGARKVDELGEVDIGREGNGRFS
jgi:hypothetical protein